MALYVLLLVQGLKQYLKVEDRKLCKRLDKKFSLQRDRGSDSQPKLHVRITWGVLETHSRHLIWSGMWPRESS